MYMEKKKLNESVNESERITLVNELKMNESLKRIKISTTSLSVFIFLLSDSVQCCCSFTEAVIRLVLSVLVGVATVAVLVDHFRSTKVELKIRKPTENSQSPSVP